MGNFYTNITLLGPTRDRVVKCLESRGRTAYVSPTQAGFTVVFDRTSDETADPAELGDLALTLSQELRCPTLAAAVFDEDVLLLGLYDRGSQIGEYNSAGARSLRASELTRIFGAVGRTTRVALFLALPHLLVVFESARHSRVLAALGMPRWAYATGYAYLQRGELPPGIGGEGFVHVG